MTPVWMDRQAQKEDGRQKPDGYGIGAMPSGGGGGRDVVFNKGRDPQMRIMEILGEMMAAARSENLRIPLAEDFRDIYLHFISKGDSIMSCTCAHAPVWGQNREAVLRYIRIGRDVMDVSRKRKFNGGGDQGSHMGHWDRSGGPVPETRGDITTETAQITVTDEVVTLVG